MAVWPATAGAGGPPHPPQDVEDEDENEEDEEGEEGEEEEDDAQKQENLALALLVLPRLAEHPREGPGHIPQAAIPQGGRQMGRPALTVGGGWLSQMMFKESWPLNICHNTPRPPWSTT